jgi:hypothetical protein
MLYPVSLIPIYALTNSVRKKGPEARAFSLSMTGEITRRNCTLYYGANASIRPSVFGLPQPVTRS